MMGKSYMTRGGIRAVSAIVLAFGLVLVAGPDSTRAQSVQAQDKESIVRALMPKNRVSPPAKPLVRSFKPITRGIEIEGPPPADEPAPSIDLVVNFEYDQSALTMSDAQITVDTLGRALTDPRLASMRFTIIGHTDAKGEDGYNLILSQRRAEAVRSRLVQFHRVDPSRLVAEGRGQRELKNPAQPLDAVNRRVQIKTILPGSGDTPVAYIPPTVPVEPAPPPSGSNKPPAPVVQVEPQPQPEPSGDRPAVFRFAALPQKPRASFLDLPSRPDPVSLQPNLGPQERITAFSDHPAAAVQILVSELTRRTKPGETPTDGELVRMAASAVDNHPEMSAMLRTAPRSIRKERMQSLIIAEVVRKLDGPTEIDFSTATRDTLMTALPALFDKATQDVHAQTRLIVEAHRLTRNMETLFDAINDLTMQGIVPAGLDLLAENSGKLLIEAIDPEAVASAGDNTQTIGEVLKRRNALVQCVIHHLPALASAAAPRQPAQRSVSTAGRITESSSIGGLSEIGLVTDLRTNCLKALSQSGGALAKDGTGDPDTVPHAPVSLTRKP